MKIFLDDERDPVGEGWTVVRTPEAFKAAVEEAIVNNEPIEAIYFDNDLGEELEGRHLLEWLVQTHPEHISENCEMEVHSQNSVGRESMKRTIQFFKENRAEFIAAKDRPDPFGEVDFRDGENKNR